MIKKHMPFSRGKKNFKFCRYTYETTPFYFFQTWYIANFSKIFQSQRHNLQQYFQQDLFQQLGMTSKAFVLQIQLFNLCNDLELLQFNYMFGIKCHILETMWSIPSKIVWSVIPINLEYCVQLKITAMLETQLNRGLVIRFEVA